MSLSPLPVFLSISVSPTHSLSLSVSPPSSSVYLSLPPPLSHSMYLAFSLSHPLRVNSRVIRAVGGWEGRRRQGEEGRREEEGNKEPSGQAEVWEQDDTAARRTLTRGGTPGAPPPRTDMWRRAEVTATCWLCSLVGLEEEGWRWRRVEEVTAMLLEEEPRRWLATAPGEGALSAAFRHRGSAHEQRGERARGGRQAHGDPAEGEVEDAGGEELTAAVFTHRWVLRSIGLNSPCPLFTSQACCITDVTHAASGKCVSVGGGGVTHRKVKKLLKKSVMCDV